jgi:serine/threonine protein kinase
MPEEQSLPKEIGGYKIIEALGEGGMSVVYTAMQEHPRRKVAIKVLRGGQFSPVTAKRFYQEVEILGKLDHPWIAKIYNAGTHDDGTGATPYYVMEHVEEACELTQYLEKEKPSRREVLKLFTMVTSAVEHGHHRGIVHRDLKPGNILIDKNGEPKIIDFGVARSLDSDKVGEEAMTEAGRLVGTVQFMSPEQVDMKITDIDARCDVYALGVVLYQMLIGRLPRTLEGLPIYEAVRQICQEDPVSPTVYDETIDRDLEAIIMKSLQTNREKRYETAGALGRDMLRYLGSKPIKARRATYLDRTKLFCKRHKKQLVVWASVLVVIAVFIATIGYFQDESNDRLDELQTRVEALSKENKNLEQKTEQKSVVDSPVVPLLLTPNKPRELVVSLDGNKIAATLEDNYYVCSIDGSTIELPPINIEPSDATIALSKTGSTFVVVSDNKCRVIPLYKQSLMPRFSGQFYGITAICVSDEVVAIATDDMSLTVLGGKRKQRRVNSTTGEFKAITIGLNGGQVIAATDRWIHLWSAMEFPRNSRKLLGVIDPCAIGAFNKRIVVVGRNGKVVINEPQKESSASKSIQLKANIDQAALNAETTVVGFISNGTAYSYNLNTSELVEATWMTVTPVGVAVDENDKLILWTEDGEVFR